MSNERHVKRVNPMTLFKTANSYRLAVLILNQGSGDTLLPALMLAAFTCELYMKAVYALENNGEMTGIHPLNKLFSKLSRPFQEKVRIEWDNNVHTLREKFPDANLDLYCNLRRSQNAFEEFRYFYERNPENFILGRLPDFMHKVLCDTDPQLRQASALFGPQTLSTGPVRDDVKA